VPERGEAIDGGRVVLHDQARPGERGADRAVRGAAERDELEAMAHRRAE
jgi:hypothetical protein